MLLRLPRYIFITLLYAGLLFSVAACSDSANSTNTNVAPPPPTADQQQIATIPPAPTAMDTLRALAPPDGLKFTPLFNRPLAGDTARITRLENAVQTLRDDVDTMAPTVVRMVAIEKDVKGLVTQLQTLTNQNQQPADGTTSAETPEELPPALPAATGGKQIPEGDAAKGTEPVKADKAKTGPAASSSLVTPEAASKGELPPAGAASPISKIPSAIQPQGLNLDGGEKTAPPKSKGATSAKTAAGRVVNMRITDSPEKTRLVLYVTDKAPVEARLINGGKTLVVNLRHYRWGGRDAWTANHTRLITGGHMKGHKLYIDLKAAASAEPLKALSPAGRDKDFRLVIDLHKRVAAARKQKVHAAAPPPAAGATPIDNHPEEAAPAPAPAAPQASADDFP